jgi:IMP dehydrogenase
MSDDGNGLAVHELFAVRRGVGLTFDDIIILPREVEAVPENVELKSGLAPKIRINPIISSPMDTVTEWETAAHMALNGCLGVLHANLPPDEAAEQVRKVKRFQMGFIRDPLCRTPYHTIADARRVKEEHGFSTIVITEDGTPRSRFLGIVTRSCIDLEERDTLRLGSVMLHREGLERRRLIAGREVKDLDSAVRIFRDNPTLTKLPILNEDGSVHALVNRNDLAKSARYPDMLADDNRQLRVFAAVTTHEEDDARVRLLLDAGADGLVIDSSQGATGYAVRRLRMINDLDPFIPVVAGNVVTPRQANCLDAGNVAAFRVGMGSGSICITQGQYGLGRAQASAVWHMAGATVIADGGIRHPGDMIKALALGASFVMVGNYIAGCDEAPGQVIMKEGRRYKYYRGMGSAGAMRDRGALRYGGSRGYNPREIVVQGEEGLVPAVGPLDDRLAEALAAVRGALKELGCASVRELHQEVREGRIRFEIRSEAAKREGAVHDLVPLPHTS